MIFQRGSHLIRFGNIAEDALCAGNGRTPLSTIQEIQIDALFDCEFTDTRTDVSGSADKKNVHNDCLTNRVDLPWLPREGEDIY